MSRRTYPRSEQAHAAAASQVLARHAMTVGQPVSLPVPIEMIIEVTYGLEILWEVIEEPPNTVVLGALIPGQRQIRLNSRHNERLFERWIGPERFTLAHELAHWIYDADHPDQLRLGLDTEESAEQYCYHRESPGLSEDLRIREINANKLAAHLLLPEDLVRREIPSGPLGNLAATAERWKVSRSALKIRLQKLGLID